MRQREREKEREREGGRKPTLGRDDRALMCQKGLFP